MTISLTTTGRRLRYGFAVLVAVVGILTAAVWGVTGVLDQVQRPEAFVRADIPGAVTFSLTQVGSHVIYYEGHGPTTLSASHVQVVDATHTVVPVRRFDLDVRYDVPGKPGALGTAIGVFDAQTTGPFTVRTDATVGDAQAKLAVGDDLAPATVRSVVLPGLAALLSIVAAIALAARTWSGRGGRNQPWIS